MKYVFRVVWISLRVLAAVAVMERGVVFFYQGF